MIYVYIQAQEASLGMDVGVKCQLQEPQAAVPLRPRCCCLFVLFAFTAPRPVNGR